MSDTVMSDRSADEASKWYVGQSGHQNLLVIISALAQEKVVFEMKHRQQKHHHIRH